MVESNHAEQGISMSRPIGAQIRSMLAASESLGRPAHGTELAQIAGLSLDSHTATRLCRRAEKYGLADAIDGWPLRFLARPGWDATRKPIVQGIKPARVEPPARIINSVA
jgi:hypothetical protein